jgi:energy-coupling factor transporter ATP-binding protein EcfA2
MAPITQSSGGVRLLGFEIRVHGHTSLFLSLENGLTVLYGRNGVGKSTILRAIENFYRGSELSWRSSEPIAFAYYELVDHFSEEAIEILMSHVPWLYSSSSELGDHSLPPDSPRDPFRMPQGALLFWREYFGSVGEPSLEKIHTQFLENLIERYGEAAPEYFSKQTVSGIRHDSHELQQVPMLNALLAQSQILCESEPVAPAYGVVPGWPLWFLTHLRAAAERHLAVLHEHEVDEGFVDLGTENDFSNIAKTVGAEAPEQIGPRFLTGSFYERPWNDIARHLVFRELNRNRTYLDALSANQSERTVRLLGTVGNAVNEIVGSRLLRVCSSGTSASPQWTYELCAKCSPESGAAFALLRERDADPAGIRGQGNENLQEVLRSSLLGLVQAGQELEDSLTEATKAHEALRAMRVSASLENDDETVALIDEYLEESEARLNSASQPTGSSAAQSASPNLHKFDLRIMRITAALAMEASIIPGVVVSAVSFTGAALPFELCDLREPLDIESHVKQLFASSVWMGGLSFSNVIDKPGGRLAPVSSNLDSEGIRRLSDHIEQVGRELARIDIGISALRFTVSEDVREWLDGNPCGLEAQDAPSQSWVPVSALSSAQQKWLGHLLRLHGYLTGRFPLLVLADEPEAGVHASAAKSALDYLASLNVTTLAASHAPSALRLPDANLILVDRDFHGHVSLGRVRTGDDVRTAAVRLGTTPMDLLGTKRLLVYVEGSHDVEVVNGLLGTANDPSLTERVLVVPARGVKNLGGVAGSLIVSDFTDLQVLVVADNANLETLDQARLDLIQLIGQGLDHQEALKQIDFEKLSKDRTLEGRVLWDLLARSTERGTLHRVHFFGLRVPDIIDTLPYRAFGLDQDWLELRSAHSAAVEAGRGGRNTKPKDFKSWLQETRKTSFNVAAIKRAFDSLDDIPEELGRLVRTIEALAQPDSARAT